MLDPVKKVLIFDFDGTLVDSLDQSFRFFNHSFAKIGMPPMKSVKEFTDMYDTNFFEGLQKYGLSEKKLDELKEIMSAVSEKNQTRTLAFPGVKEIINQLAKKFRLAIVTSGFEEYVKRNLTEDKIYISEILGADHITSKVEKLGRLKNENPDSECYYIADTLGDIIESQRAGVKTVAVTWGFHSREKLLRAKPDFIVDRPEELLHIFN